MNNRPSENFVRIQDGDGITASIGSFLAKFYYRHLGRFFVMPKSGGRCSHWTQLLATVQEVADLAVDLNSRGFLRKGDAAR
jgi:hypothetical protein